MAAAPPIQLPRSAVQDPKGKESSLLSKDTTWSLAAWNISKKLADEGYDAAVIDIPATATFMCQHNKLISFSKDPSSVLNFLAFH
jgi:hypothetical protein